MPTSAFEALNYERARARTTRYITQNFLSSVNPPIDASSYVLDNACGPGVVTDLIKSKVPDVRIVCADYNVSMLKEASKKAKVNGWTKFSAVKLDMRKLHPLKDNTFSHVVTNFGLQSNVVSLHSPKEATKEIYRVLQPGGTALISIWSGKLPTLLKPSMLMA